MVWSRLKILRLSKTILQGTVKEAVKEMKAEEMMGIQYQGMDRFEGWIFPWDIKVGKNCCDTISSAPATFSVQGRE